jgi:hypothetical protein
MAEQDETGWEEILRRRVGVFLSERSPWLSPLARGLAILPGCRPLFLFGGWVRDVLLYGPNASPRDVDLVIGGTTVGELEAVLSPHVDRRTRFGGLQLVVEGTPIDIWPLETTWAFRAQGNRSPTFADLPKTTFLNVEAIALELDEVTGRTGRLYTCGFFEGIRDRVLDINYEANPSPPLCVARSLNLAVKLDYQLGTRLREYILRQLLSTSLEDVVALHAEIGGCKTCSRAVIAEWKAILYHPLTSAESVDR